jgi:hypothetical protein
MHRMHCQGRKSFLTVVLLAALAGCGGDDPAVDSATIETLSSRPDVVSGGETLLRVKLTPASATSADVTVTAGGMDVTSSLLPGSEGSLVGVVGGLPDGSSNIVVARKDGGDTLAQLTVVNHSVNGPNFAGPRDAIFGCETAAWGLAATTNADCTAPTVVTYQYRTTGGTFKPYPTTGAAPTDVATTTLLNGATVDYVVRIETGVIDRSVYQMAGAITRVLPMAALSPTCSFRRATPSPPPRKTHLPSSAMTSALRRLPRWSRNTSSNILVFPCSRWVGAALADRCSNT